MKSSLIAFAFVCTTACGASTPPAASPSTSNPSGVTAAQPSSDPARALDERECRSLGQWLVDACENRSNQRSARVDGWCSDVRRGVESGAWIAGDCVKHIKYMDAVCFRSTTGVSNMMECDNSVQRP
jgi:hypothetical protein